MTAPSGSGKTTIVHYLLKEFSELAFSVSATTRPMRSGEADYVDYHFLTPEEFQERIDNGEFLEWEEVYPGKRYGSLRSEVERHWSAGKVVVFDVDVKGALRLKSILGDRALSLFIKPPSLAVLKGRLEKRGSEGPEGIRQRVERASEELTYAHRFDAVVVNDNLETAFKAAREVVERWLRESP